MKKTIYYLLLFHLFPKIVFSQDDAVGILQKTNDALNKVKTIEYRVELKRDHDKSNIMNDNFLKINIRLKNWYLMEFELKKTPLPEECISMIDLVINKKDFLPIFIKRTHLKGNSIAEAQWVGCGPCIQSVPFLNELQKTYGPKGMEVIGVNLYGKDKQFLIDYVNKINMKYKIVWQTDKVGEFFGIKLAPTFYLIDKNGKILPNIHDIISKLCSGLK
jgi:thiol-disulfide isomerase/thioredoxin